MQHNQGNHNMKSNFAHMMTGLEWLSHSQLVSSVRYLLPLHIELLALTLNIAGSNAALVLNIAISVCKCVDRLIALLVIAVHTCDKWSQDDLLRNPKENARLISFSPLKLFPSFLHFSLPQHVDPPLVGLVRCCTGSRTLHSSRSSIAIAFADAGA